MTFYLIATLILCTLGFFLFVRWGSSWGSTPEERALTLPGDAYLEDGPPVRVVMTRAISIKHGVILPLV